MTELTNRIKEEAAKTFGYESFSTAQETILNLRQKSGFEKIIDRCISLASQVEAGITIEQAKDLAAKEAGFITYDHAFREINKIQSYSNRLDRLNLLGNRIAELYASSAVEAAEKVAVEKERELREENRRLKFMIDNGLGWEDMKNDIELPKEL